MTVWLTQITLNPYSRSVRRDLGDAVAAHRRVMSLVPAGLGDQARRKAGVLYRVEQTSARPRLLLQSAHRPDDRRLPTGYGTVSVTTLDPLLAMLDKGLIVRYRLVANPTKRHGRTSPHSGKLAVLTGASADQWWVAQAERAGLSLHTATTTSLPDLLGHRTADEGRIVHATRRFEGHAVVTDPTALRAAVLDGIGRGKSHGCGLLSLAPAGPR